MIDDISSKDDSLEKLAPLISSKSPKNYKALLSINDKSAKSEYNVKKNEILEANENNNKISEVNKITFPKKRIKSKSNSPLKRIQEKSNKRKFSFPDISHINLFNKVLNLDEDLKKNKNNIYNCEENDINNSDEKSKFIDENQKKKDEKLKNCLIEKREDIENKMNSEKNNFDKEKIILYNENDKNKEYENDGVSNSMNKNRKNNKNAKGSKYIKIKDPLAKESNEIIDKPKGFENIGSSCYMNSFLQILIHTPFFLSGLIKIKSERNLNCSLINNIIELKKNPSYNCLRAIKKSVADMDESFGYNIQNDSQEFGIGLINKIITCIKGEMSFSDESNPLKNKITPSNLKYNKKLYFDKYKKKYFPEENEIFLEKMFTFHESKINYEFKENKEEIRLYFETFSNIELIFPKEKKNHKFSLLDLLKFRYKDDNLKKNKIQLEIKNNFEENGENEFQEQNSDENIKKNENNGFCNNFKRCISFCWNSFKNIICYCSKAIAHFFCCCFYSSQNNDENNTEYIKEDNKDKFIPIIRLASLPEILIISIDRALLGLSFNDDVLIFDKELDLKKFIDSDILNNICTKYELYAVNECLGHSKNSGHYYSFVKINNKNWFKFSDLSVTENNPNFSSKYVVGLYYIRNDIK